MPRAVYTNAVPGVYELNKINLLKDVFIWAYERSAARYAAVRQSLGEPDPFRLQHRDSLRALVREIVRQGMTRKEVSAHIAVFAGENVVLAEWERFREVVENELLALHEGNYARFQIKPAEFEAWRRVWNGAAI